MAKRKPFEWERFIRLWQTSKNMQEFCKRYGLAANAAAISKASIYRRRYDAIEHGIRLKKLRFEKVSTRPDWKFLAELAAKLEKNGKQGPIDWKKLKTQAAAAK